jgi:hypothetical protein
MFAKFRVKKAYFEARKILGAADRMRRRALAKQGALVRTDARRSIRKTKNPKLHSAPGRPPKTHRENGGLKNSILFAVDNVSVITGTAKKDIGMVGNTHEHGGQEINKRKTKNDKNSFRWKPVVGGYGPIAIRGRVHFAKNLTPAQAARSLNISDLAEDILIGRAKIYRNYPPRPFMNPSLKKLIDNGALLVVYKNALGG